MRTFPVLWRRPMELSRQIDRMFDDVMNGWPFETSNLGRTDIYERDGQLVYATELPGVKREDIHIQVEDGSLVISGETKREEKVEEQNYFRIGRSYGRFQRSFPLPDEVSDPNKIEAKVEDGVLKISVPLAKSIKEKERPIEIPIR